jgi:phage replication-related protein YjqB (UPF0714/DUF867 family)
MNQKENQSIPNMLDQAVDEKPAQREQKSGLVEPEQKEKPEKREDVIDKMVRAGTAAILSLLGGGVTAGIVEQVAEIDIEFGSFLFYLIPMPLIIILFFVFWNLLNHLGKE